MSDEVKEEALKAIREVSLNYKHPDLMSLSILVNFNGDSSDFARLISEQLEKDMQESGKTTFTLDDIRIAQQKVFN